MRNDHEMSQLFHVIFLRIYNEDWSKWTLNTCSNTSLEAIWVIISLHSMNVKKTHYSEISVLLMYLHDWFRLRFIDYQLLVPCDKVCKRFFGLSRTRLDTRFVEATWKNLTPNEVCCNLQGIHKRYNQSILTIWHSEAKDSLQNVTINLLGCTMIVTRKLHQFYT